jgi:hypothetical protein
MADPKNLKARVVAATEAKDLANVPSAVRKTSEGLIKTGYSFFNLMEGLDIHSATGAYVDDHGDEKRRKMLDDYLNQGRPWSSFSSTQRRKIEVDTDIIASALKKGGYKID